MLSIRCDFEKINIEMMFYAGLIISKIYLIHHPKCNRIEIVINITVPFSLINNKIIYINIETY